MVVDMRLVSSIGSYERPAVGILNEIETDNEKVTPLFLLFIESVLIGVLLDSFLFFFSVSYYVGYFNSKTNNHINWRNLHLGINECM